METGSGTDIEAVLIAFIANELARSPGVALDPQTSLISAGILDSLALLKLILFVEERFEVKVGDGEVTPDNFETVAAIRSLIESKQPAARQ